MKGRDWKVMIEVRITMKTDEWKNWKKKTVCKDGGQEIRFKG